MKYVFYITGLLFFTSCWQKRNFQINDLSKKVIGWKPIYAADSISKKVSYTANPTPTIKPGKIYVYNNLIYQNDVGTGIHIINNTNPAAAQKIGFIKINGNTDIAIKGNYLYANNYMDMIVVDISNSTNPIVIKRLPNVYSSNFDANYPWVTPPEPGYYECPEYTTDSIIVNWVKDSVQQYCKKL